MAPSKRAKAAGVSASSFLDLKAELAKEESEITRRKNGAQPVGGVPRNGKGRTVWARPNKGVAARNARDLEIKEATSGRHTTASLRAALERKAEIYDKLRRGKTGGLSDAQYDALLVDFDSKALDEHFSSDSEDVDESLTVPSGPVGDDDPIIEYEDEFGRMRTARRSEVPRDLMPNAEAEEAVEDDPFVIRGPVDHFPVYEPSAERVAAIQEAASEAANPLATHYDAAREVRAKGAGFYSFSADEEARAREMEALRAAREETARARQETGAVDVKPGEVEGMVEDVGGEGKGKGKEVVMSRAMEKRKREMEERKKLVEAKRRKLKGLDTTDEGMANGQAEKPGDVVAVVGPPAAAESTVKDVAPSQGKSRWDQTKKKKAKAKVQTGPTSASAADDFLAQLEKDIIGKAT
ncbi:hypothetical protein M0805_006309 [Coniferiporia weirii]|nr:hypothetical protein M0805_006309 [Coniferiporia weirii]